MYLLSTASLADLVSRDEGRPLLSWLRETQPAPNALFSSVISFGIIASSIEDLPKHDRGGWRRLLQEGRRQFIEQGTIVDIDGLIVDTWASSLRGLELRDEAGDGERFDLGEDERLVIATAITRGLTLVSPSRPYLEMVCDSTSLTVVSP